MNKRKTNRQDKIDRAVDAFINLCPEPADYPVIVPASTLNHQVFGFMNQPRDKIAHRGFDKIMDAVIPTLSDVNIELVKINDLGLRCNEYRLPNPQFGLKPDGDGEVPFSSVRWITMRGSLVRMFEVECPTGHMSNGKPEMELRRLGKLNVPTDDRRNYWKVTADDHDFPFNLVTAETLACLVEKMLPCAKHPTAAYALHRPETPYLLLGAAIGRRTIRGLSTVKNAREEINRLKSTGHLPESDIPKLAALVE